MATYVNDLRLKEIATGDEAGTWGTSTNTNLELIGEALGYGTQDCFSTDADATTTVADGATDPARAMYFKVTSSATLTAGRTLTIAPNTISRVMFIENATTGSQTITISQGTGGNVAIANGKTAVVYLDGAGSGAAVVDAMALVDPGITDTLAEVLVAGNTSSGTDIELTTTDKVQFRDSAIYLNSSADGQLDIVADTEVQIATTTLDLNGILDVSGNTTLGADVTFTGASYNAVWDSSDNALEFGDDAKAVFGAGSDLLIYHDGSNSYISETGTGSLRIRSNQIRLEAPDSQNMVIVTEDAGVQAFYNGTERFTVTNTGIDVTGTVTADGLTVSATSDALITIADSTLPSIQKFDLKHNAGASSLISGNNGAYGTFALQAYNGTSTINRLNIGSGGDITFYDTDGSTASFVYDASAGLTINEAGADRDFRVESDTVSHMLFVDGGANHVNIGLSSDLGGILNVGGNIALSDNPTLNWSSNTLTLESRNAIGVLALSGASSGFNPRMDFLNGTGDRVHRISADGNAVFNEQGNNTDFRVESTSNANMLFVDAGNDRVGIGTGSPSAKATIEDGDFARLDLNLANSSGTTIADVRGLVEGTEKWRIGKISSSSDDFRISVLESEVMKFASSEAVVNENSTDYDFRVESDLFSHALFVDAGNNRIGLFDGSPDRPVHLKSNGSRNYIKAETTTASISNEAGFDIKTPNTNLLIGALGGGTPYTYFYDLANGYGNLLKLHTAEDGAVFNDDSHNLDFRVESNSNNQALLVDAGGDFVAMGNTIKNPASGFSDQHGVGIDVQNGSVQIASDAQPLEINRTTTGGPNGSFINFRQEGTSSYSIGMDTVGMVFNEAGSDKDFRVESENQANMFRVDAGTDRVAVKLITSEPANVLDVNGDISFTRTVSKKISTGAANANYFVIYEKDFETSAFTTNQHWVRITGAGSTSGTHASAEFYVTFKQQGTGKFFNIVPIENTALTIGYTYDASGGASSAGQLKIYAASGVFYNYIQVFATAREGNPDEDVILGAFPMTDTGSGTAPAGMTTMAFPLNYGANKYQLSGYSSSQYVINEDSNDLDFRVESDSNTHALFVDAGNNRVGINNSSPAKDLDVTGSMNVTQSGGDYAATFTTAFDYVAKFVSSDAAGFIVLQDSNSTDNYNRIGAVGDSIQIESGNVENALFTSTASVFNENSADQDFRVESNNDANAIFVDASNDRTMFGRADVSVGEDFCAIDARPGTSGHVIRTGRDDNSTKNHIVFINPNGTVGSIQTAASTTIYNTSSDQRLKENIADAEDAGALIDAIQVRKFDWIADGEHQRYGMVAQELNTVAPEAVSEGETEEDMMGVDYSKLVPMLIKEIQSLRARVAQLENT